VRKVHSNFPYFDFKWRYRNAFPQCARGAHFVRIAHTAVPRGKFSHGHLWCRLTSLSLISRTPLLCGGQWFPAGYNSLLTPAIIRLQNGGICAHWLSV